MENLSSDLIENTKSELFSEENHRKPHVINEQKVECTSNIDAPETLKSFIYSREKDNQKVQIKINLKLMEQLEKIQGLKKVLGI